MTALGIEFEWFRDKAGYDLLCPEELSASNAEIYAQSPFLRSLGPPPTGLPTRILRRGGEPVPYRPFDEIDLLYKIFANRATTAQGLLEFVWEFGPLTEAGKSGNANQGGWDEVEYCLWAAETMREFDQLSEVERVHYLSTFGPGGLGWTQITLKLFVHPVTRKPQLKLTPTCLLNGLWMECALAAADGAHVRQCSHCGIWFRVGPGTGRREDSKFCSDGHRIDFNSDKRKIRKSSNA